MTGKPTLDKILIGLSLAVAAFAAGFSIYTQTIFEKVLPTDEQELGKLHEDSSKVLVPQTFQLDRLIVNLQSRRTRLRFLEVDIHLIPFKEAYLPALEEAKTEIRDIIIDVTGKMAPTELNSVAGKILLENQLKKRINNLYSNPTIKKILFSHFVIQ